MTIYNYFISKSTIFSIFHNYYAKAKKKIQRLISVFYFVAILLLKLSCSQNFHVKSAQNFVDLDQNVTQIKAINDTTLIIVKGDLDNTSIVTLSGPYLRTKTKIISQKKLKQNPKITNNQILLNYGNYISTQQIIKTSKNYNYSSINSNKMGVTPNYAIFTQSFRKNTSLIYIDLQTKEDFMVFYQELNKINFNGFVFNFGYDQIAYITDFKIYIINLGDKIPQYIYQYKQFVVSLMESADTWVDIQQRKRAVLLNFGSMHYLIWHQVDSHQFTQLEIYCPSKILYLTGIATGISFTRQRLYRWGNFNNHLLYYNLQDDQSQYMIQQYPVVVMNSQRKFATCARTQKQTSLMIYSIGVEQDMKNNNYRIKLQNIIVIESGYAGVLKHSGLVAADDRYILGLLVDFNGGQYVVKFDVLASAYQIMSDDKIQRKPTKCQSIGLISQQTIATICQNVQTQCTQDLDLQLRYISNMSIIDKIPLLQSQTLPNYRILSNQKWNNRFVVQQYSDDKQDNCRSSLFKINNNKIIDLQIYSTQISQLDAKATSNYIVSMKRQQQEQASKDQYLKVFSISDLKMVKKYYYPNVYLDSQYKMYWQRDIIIVQELSQPFLTDIYDFSVHMDRWYQGGIFRKYFASDIINQGGQWMIFPQYKMFYIYPVTQTCLQKSAKVIYDISAPSISEVVMMSQQVKQQQYKYKYLYVPAGKLELDYSLVFFLRGNKMYKFKDSKPYEAPEIYELDEFIYGDFSSYSGLYFSSDKKHLIIRYQVFMEQSRYRIQIRPLNLLSQIIWHHESSDESFNNVDLTSERLIILNTISNIQIFKLQQTQSSINFQMEQFALTDTNLNGQLVFIGKLINKQNTTRIVYKKSKQSLQFIYLDLVPTKQITMLAFCRNCSFFITYTQDQIVRVWQIKSNVISYFNQFKCVGVKSIQFASIYKIVIQTQGSIFIRNVQDQDVGQSQNIINGQVGSDRIIYDLADDGSILAKSQIKNVVQINTAERFDQKLANLTLKNMKLTTALSFSSQGSLFIATNQQTLIIVANQSCPINSVNNNLQCFCYKSFSKIDGMCICYQGSFIANNECMQCAFPCKTCTGSAQSCQAYTAGFYALVVFSCLTFLSIVGGILYVIYTKRQQKLVPLIEEESDQVSKYSRSTISGQNLVLN